MRIVFRVCTETVLDDFLHVESFGSDDSASYLKISLVIDLNVVAAGEFILFETVQSQFFVVAASLFSSAVFILEQGLPVETLHEGVQFGEDFGVVLVIAYPVDFDSQTASS